MAISTGQITIIDYYDAVSLTGYIGANLSLTQVFNPDNASYSPSYASTNLVLTPSLYKAGTGTDIIATAQVKSIKWYDSASPTTELVADTNYALAAFASGTNRPLTIKANVMNGATVSKTYICEVVYTDAGTGLDLTYKTDLTITRVNNSGGVTFANVTTPNGNVFKNSSGSNLIAQADLMRGSGIDTSAVTYKWYKADATATTVSGGDADGGNGWRLLTATFTGYNTYQLTVKTTDISSLAQFKCIITDTDSTSPTYNQKFSGTVTIVDQTDPVQVVVVSSGGDVFKGGNGSTVLTGKVYQNGAEIDAAGTKYTYRWYKYDANAALVTAWGGAGIDYKTGKTLNIGGNDVDVKATFVLEIS